MPNPRIHVGGLPYTYGDPELLALFTPFGPVRSARVMRDRDTGESRGFAFVEMENAEHAQKAIATLNGQRCEGMALRVSEAREREARPSNGSAPGRPASPAPRPPSPGNDGHATSGSARPGHGGERAGRSREAERSSHQAKRPIKGKGPRGRFDDDSDEEY